MGVKRTTIELDEDRLAEAQRILGTTGVKDTVDRALHEVLRREAIRRLDTWVEEVADDLLDPETIAARRGYDRLR